MEDTANETTTSGRGGRPKSLTGEEITRLRRAFEAWRVQARPEQVRVVAHALGLLLSGGRTGRSGHPLSTAGIRRLHRVTGPLLRYDAALFGTADGKK